MQKIINFAEIIRLLDSTATDGLQALARNIETLANQRDEALAALRKAREENADLRYEMGLMREELQRKTLDAEYLSLSHKLAEGPQALAEARATVRGLIARIDKAIALLKEDARI